MLCSRVERCCLYNCRSIVGRVYSEKLNRIDDSCGEYLTHSVLSQGCCMPLSV